MPTFQIDAVEPGFREWSPADNPKLVFRYYTVRFAGEQGKGEADLKRKANDPPPYRNEVLEDYEIVAKPGRRSELKKIKAASALGGPKSGDFRTPEQIMRSYAHGQAMRWIDVRVALLSSGTLEDKETKELAKKLYDYNWTEYIKMVDAFYQDTKEAT